MSQETYQQRHTRSGAKEDDLSCQKVLQEGVRGLASSMGCNETYLYVKRDLFLYFCHNFKFEYRRQIHFWRTEACRSKEAELVNFPQFHFARFVVLPLIALASPEWSMNDIAGKVGSSRWLIMVHQVHPDPRATDAADTLTPQKCFVLCLFWWEPLSLPALDFTRRRCSASSLAHNTHHDSSWLCCRPVRCSWAGGAGWRRSILF